MLLWKSCQFTLGNGLIVVNMRPLPDRVNFSCYWSNYDEQATDSPATGFPQKRQVAKSFASPGLVDAGMVEVTDYKFTFLLLLV